MGWTAHVRYVTDDDAGPDVSPGALLSEVFTDPVGLVLMGLVVAGLLAYVWVVPRLPGWGAFRATLNATLNDYGIFVPWILRLSAGIALMGAGLAAYHFVPHLEGSARGFVSLVSLAAGFMVLLGFALRLAALVGLVLWSYTFALHGFDALMAAEVVAALVALTAISSGRPSIDDIWAKALPSAPWGIQRAGVLRAVLGPSPDDDVSEAFGSWIPVVLRVGLGLSLGYAGLAEKWLAPGPALGTVERYDLAFWLLTPERWVVMVGLIEIVLGLGLIIGIAVRPLAALGFLVLTATLFLLPDDPVVAHVPLWGVASAVFVLGCGPYSVDRWRLRRAAVMAE